jgi:Taurine catabolism dioxygenase TauD, TfdA family
MLSEIEFDAVEEGLQSFGYAVVRTAGDERVLMSAAHALGHLVGARSFGYVYLRAVESGFWLGRHTESLTDGPTPLRYFASGCLVPAMEGGATHLYDGSRAARLLAGLMPGADEVRIRYRSAYRPEVSDHPLAVEHEQYGRVLRFRSASEHNTVIAKPVGLSEADLYAAVEELVSVSLALVHTWSIGDLLVVDNHRMLHSRAPFAGLRHMVRVRYDDPLHQTVTPAG